MTELLSRPVEVHVVDPDGALATVRLEGRWRRVERVVARWVVETDWWRAPGVHREYRRCLLGGVDGEECVELCHDLVEGGWWLVRRYD